VSGHICPERLLLPEALTGRLEPAEEKRVMAHLQTCPACQDAAADIEVSLISLATVQAARDEAGGSTWDAAEPVLPGLRVVANASDNASAGTALPSAPFEPIKPSQPTAIPRRHPMRRTLLVAAAAVVLLVAGAAAGHQLLPPRDANDYGPALALAPPPGVAGDAATGSVAVAQENNALAVRLTADGLPVAGWYECVWNSAGQSRSAGSFRADKGAVDVELRVAPPKAPGAWTLQVIAHTGASSRVVLQGSAVAPS
jgi:hypothetical protein